MVRYFLPIRSTTSGNHRQAALVLSVSRQSRSVPLPKTADFRRRLPDPYPHQNGSPTGVPGPVPALPVVATARAYPARFGRPALSGLRGSKGCRASSRGSPEASTGDQQATGFGFYHFTQPLAAGSPLGCGQRPCRNTLRHPSRSRSFGKVPVGRTARFASPAWLRQPPKGLRPLENRIVPTLLGRRHTHKVCA